MKNKLALAALAAGTMMSIGAFAAESNTMNGEFVADNNTTSVNNCMDSSCLSLNNYTVYRNGHPWKTCVVAIAKGNVALSCQLLPPKGPMPPKGPKPLDH